MKASTKERTRHDARLLASIDVDQQIASDELFRIAEQMKHKKGRTAALDLAYWARAYERRAAA